MNNKDDLDVMKAFKSDKKKKQVEDLNFKIKVNKIIYLNIEHSYQRWLEGNSHKNLDQAVRYRQ